jgi:hypothetical protein
MPKRCKWRRRAALASARSIRARACYECGLREFARLGLGELFAPVLREKEVGRQLALMIDRNRAETPLLALVPRLAAFARFCRRERSLVRAIVTQKENAHVAGAA